VTAKRPLTPRQAEFYAAVLELREALGRNPKTAEIGAKLGIGRTGAMVQLSALEAKGWLENIPQTVKSGRWRVQPDTDAAPRVKRARAKRVVRT
jgi:hypothetical protein